MIIPAFNEEKSVDKVVCAIQKVGLKLDILVVNDGSTDHTSEIARQSGAIVIDLPINLGIGGAVQTGFKYAWKNNYDIAIQLDADGQHDPQDLHRVIDPIQAGTVDFVIGSRFVMDTGYSGSTARRIGMIIFSTLVSLICRQSVKDTTSGYRAADRRVIEFFATSYPSDYPEVEAVVMLSKQGFKIAEVPVTMKARASGKSSITPLKSVYYMLKVSLALLMNISRPRAGEKGGIHSGN